MTQLPRFRRLPRRLVTVAARPYGGPWNASEEPFKGYQPQPITLDGQVWKPEFCDPEATTRELSTEEL